jgi:alpha-glucuronidase
MSQANLYAFARLTWNPDLSAREISEEWTRVTFGPDRKVIAVVNAIQLDSWKKYENDTGLLGPQTLTGILGNHDGVAVEAFERNGWGQWHNADTDGVGMDRTVRSVTGFTSQYRPEIAKMYEVESQTHDQLLVFFHHAPYSHKLRSGETVVEHLYDSHYEGAEVGGSHDEAFLSTVLCNNCGGRYATSFSSR